MTISRAADCRRTRPRAAGTSGGFRPGPPRRSTRSPPHARERLQALGSAYVGGAPNANALLFGSL